MGIPLGDREGKTEGQEKIEQAKVPASSNYKLPFAFSSAAVLLLAVLIFRADIPLLGTPAFEPQQQSFVSSIGQQQLIELNDGSSAMLNTNSQIKVNYTKGYRDIYLQRGEAHFTVAHNKTQPFRVFAGSSSIRAVGTAFAVNINKQGVDVTVTEGVVSLDSLTAPSKLNSAQPQNIAVETLGTLKAGQAATIVSATGTNQQPTNSLENFREIEYQSMTKKMSWTQGSLLFTGEPLHEVVEKISRYSTVNIELANPQIAAIKVAGLFPIGEMEALYQSLEDNFDLRVSHVADNQVLIHSENL